MAVWKYKDKWRSQVWIHNKLVAQKSGFDKKKDAQRWHDETCCHFRVDPSQFEKEEENTFLELLEKFRQLHLPTVRPATQARYEIDIRDRIEPYFRFMKLKKIDNMMIEGFKAKLMGKIKPKSINNCLLTLRLILSKGVKWKMLAKNPYEIDPLKIDTCRDLYWWDDKNYIALFLNEARKCSRYFPAYVLALETGMRLGEIIGLSKKDVDFNGGRIRVWRQWSDKFKGYGPTKGGKERWIDFDPNGYLAAVLSKAIKDSPHVEAIFTTSTGRRVLNRKLASAHFKPLIRRVGIPEISFHGLRHTFASWYMVEIDDIWSLKNILGHTDIKTTQRYAHHSVRHKRKPLNLTSFSNLDPSPIGQLRLINS